MEANQEALRAHYENEGKIEITPKVKVETMQDLSVVYTPGVAQVSKEIAADPEKVFDYTLKKNTIAIVSDGSAVLGLGNIGPEAALPVMEGKAMLFKEFGGVNAFPICLATQDTEEIIQTVKFLQPVFGGINLEDISAPRCFEIEKRLIEECRIPVFHDDQHGTAIVVCAGLLNALKLVGKSIETAKIVINGAGSAGLSIAKLLLEFKAKNIMLVDLKGIIAKESDWLNSEQAKMAQVTNPKGIQGDLNVAIEQADVFIGVSAADVLKKEMAQKMNRDAIVFAMANPTPEIMPEVAKEAGVRIMATGRSDYPNQINNVLVFPGIFKGALACRASKITTQMKTEAAKAIASLVTEEELKEDYIIPNVFDKRVSQRVAQAVIDCHNASLKG